VEESQRHAHVSELGKVLLDLLVKEDADEQQAQADNPKEAHRFSKLLSKLRSQAAMSAISWPEPRYCRNRLDQWIRRKKNKEPRKAILSAR
jgi:hypothetical protein